LLLFNKTLFSGTTIYRLTFSDGLDAITYRHVRLADNINPDTIDIGFYADKSIATYLIEGEPSYTYPKLQTTADLDGMRVLSIVGGKTPTISVLEPPRVIPSNNRNNLYKAPAQSPPPRAR
jgi:hypothetical protein